MVIMNKWLIFLFLMILVIPLHAQKELKEIRTLLKNKKGKEAAALVDKLLNDSIYENEPQLFNWRKEAYIIINNFENEKIYLKKSYDTVMFFQSTYHILYNIIQCENAEQKLLAERGKKMKFHKGNQSLLHQYYKNLSVAGRYFFNKNNYGESAKIFGLYIDIPYLSIWGDDKRIVNEQTFKDNVYLYQYSSFMNNDLEGLFKYKNITLEDTTHRKSYIELLTLASEAKNDTTAYIDYLKLGLNYYPENPFFFTRLNDYYTQQGLYHTSLLMADSLLISDCSNVLYLEAKNLALLNLKMYEEAIQASLYTLKINKFAKETYYYLGAAYCNLANEIHLPTNFNSNEYNALIDKQKAYYRVALPYLEEYRNLEPEQMKKWAPLLYRIFLSLNMGKEFDEIESLMKNL